ncbi:uncharacterized protein METZ01_LOCUS48382, partial [marine metagenome]
VAARNHEPPRDYQSVDDRMGTWDLNPYSHALHLDEPPVEVDDVVSNDD